MERLVIYVCYMEYGVTAVLIQVEKYMEWEISDGTFTSTRENGIS